MRQAQLFGRLITAIVTPFDGQGEVDFDTYADLVDFQFSNGADTLCVCGTTGESPTIDTADKLALFGQTVRLAQGRGKVLANVGSNNTAASVTLAREAAALGVDGVMCVAPYYNKPSQEGMFQHFKAVADAVPQLPLVIYNIPGRAVVTVEPQTIIRLAEACPNVRGMKEAALDIEKSKQVLAEVPGDFEMFSGNDDKTLDLMAIGASGVISTTSNVVPRLMADMVAAFASGDQAGAKQLHARLEPLMTGLFKAPNPTLVKKALELIGRPVGGLRLPLVEATQDQTAFIRGVLTDLGVDVAC